MDIIPPDPFTHLLVGVDLSENCARAFRKALRIGKHNEATVTCIHVVPRSGDEAKSFDSMYRSDISDNKLLEEYALPWLENWVADQLNTYVGNLPDWVELTTRVGNPHDEILQFAEDEGCDLIVLGTHGRSGLERWWLGSVAEKVIRRADCPVMTVREE